MLRQLRTTPTGRAAIVALGVLVLWSIWNVTFRPYNESALGWQCPSPMRLVTDDPPERDRSRFGTIGNDSITLEGWEECRDKLSTSGFWLRGVTPLAVAVAGLAAARYVATGTVLSEAESHSPEESAQSPAGDV